MPRDHHQFAEIFDDVYPGLCRFLECLVGRNGVAQEIAQESFLRLFRAGLDVVPRSETRFWLYRVARNLALNELNRRSTQSRLKDSVANLFRRALPTPEEDFERAERNRIVIELIASLPEHQRAALLLREQEEMSYSEIARVLNISESKVKVDIFRARLRLKESWLAARRSTGQ
jgi:RNA polymerase sigma-70 factor (ECF subfamily)